VTCPDWEGGPGASLRCGLAALPEDAEAAVVVLADGPELDPSVMSRGLLVVESRVAFEPYPAGAHELQGLDPESADAQRCWRWIRGQVSFTRGGLTGAMRHVMNATRISAALKVLVGRNLIDTEHGATSPGTRERTFRVNPRTEVADGVA